MSDRRWQKKSFCMCHKCNSVSPWCEFKCHTLMINRSTFIEYAGFRYFCSSFFFNQRKLELVGGALSDRMALKKNTFVPTVLSVRAALGSLYLYTPHGAFPRKVALKPAAAGKRTGCEFTQPETKGEHKVQTFKAQQLHFVAFFWISSLTAPIRSS